jgi:hypothetical protein
MRKPFRVSVDDMFYPFVVKLCEPLRSGVTDWFVTSEAPFGPKYQIIIEATTIK